MGVGQVGGGNESYGLYPTAEKEPEFYRGRGVDSGSPGTDCSKAQFYFNSIRARDICQGIGLVGSSQDLVGLRDSVAWMP